MKRLLILVLLAVSALAQTRDTYPRIPAKGTVAQMLAISSPVDNMRWTITDALTATDVTTGGGSTRVDAVYNGSAWVLAPGGSGGSSTTYYGNFHTGARGASSANLPCCGWATTVTSGAGFASAVSSADYSRTVLTFADAASTSANWFGAVPPNYTNQTVTVRFTWMVTVATAANIRVEVASAFVAPGASYVPTFNTVQLATSANGGNGIQNTVSFTLDMTGADPGDEWFIRFRRLGADALDTLDGQTINLIRMEISY